jgi:hypothetical protein
VVSSHKITAEVGARIRVFWPLDQAWYHANVSSVFQQGEKQLHQILYDDGDEETLDLGDAEHKVTY